MNSSVDLQTAVVSQVRSIVERGDREAVSVLVVPAAGAALTEAIAALVGPLLAGRLYPDRSFGSALNIEPGDRPGSFIVDVLVAHPFSAVRFNQGAGSKG